MSTETQRAEFNEAVSGFRMAANFGRGSSMTSALHEACDLLESQAAELAALKAENEALRKDAERLAYVYSGQKTICPSLLELELRLINDDVPKIEEVRQAIDAAMQTKEAS